MQMVEVISFVSKAQKQSGVPEEGSVQTDIETRTGWDMNIEMEVVIGVGNVSVRT